MRLRRNRDFQAAYRARKSWSSPHFVLYIRMRPAAGVSPDQPVRFGFVISKKIAKRAHDRNRLKRRLREICRHQVAAGIPQGSYGDIVFVARVNAPRLDFAQIADEVMALSGQAGLLSQRG